MTDQGAIESIAGLEIDRSYSKHLRDAARRLRAILPTSQGEPS